MAYFLFFFSALYLTMSFGKYAVPHSHKELDHKIDKVVISMWDCNLWQEHDWFYCNLLENKSEQEIDVIWRFKKYTYLYTRVYSR